MDSVLTQNSRLNEEGHKLTGAYSKTNNVVVDQRFDVAAARFWGELDAWPRWMTRMHKGTFRVAFDWILLRLRISQAPCLLLRTAYSC